jgi:molecular chaperone DnaK
LGTDPNGEKKETNAMARMTIDFGIDLGTTNSAIAVLNGTHVDVFKNNEGFKYTPSVVWIDKKNGLHVGRRAKERLDEDPRNAFGELKLQMGTNEEKVFEHSERRMKPEELSTEVLKSLKADVKQRSGEDVLAAVIGVPAAFQQPQSEATNKAAQLAGFVSSPLLQEPVAAALAYGFQSSSDKVFWLVYDFGGGTFDAAVIQVRDEAIRVVNHCGDNHLGGKLIDWEIVEQLLIPTLTKQNPLSDFRRGNPKWISAIAKLKYHAELAKIRVSREESAEIIIDFLCLDDQREPVRFEYELKRAEVARLAEPFILRSVNIAKKTLAEKHLGPAEVEKVLLVGGPTLAPYLRERLADRNQGLGIPLEFSVDPLTVVARDAAIFAGTQRLEGITLEPPGAGQYAIELDYKPVGADTEPIVGGRVISERENLSRFTIEFINAEAQPPWRSGKVCLGPNGSFVTTLWAERGRQNVFLIELCDSWGTKQPTVPDRLTYTIGLTVLETSTIHSIGVALANNEMAWFIPKGTPLPAHRREVLRTAIAVSRGQAGHVIKIPVMEGEKSRADHNQEIGKLEISAENIKRDVPAGSEIEVTVDMDASRLIRTKAYIPILDEEFEDVVNYQSYREKARDPEGLRRDLDGQQERLRQARQKAGELCDAQAQQVLARIDAERMVPEVETSLSASRGDRDAADKCEHRLLDLKSALDEVEDALEWPALVAEAEKELEVERKIVNNSEFGITAQEKATFAALEREIRSALGTRDPDQLRRKVGELDRLGVTIMLRQPGWWVAQLDHLEKRRSELSNPSLADDYIAQGRRAMHNNDLSGLQAAVRQLASLLPAGDADRTKLMSGVIR